MSTKLTPSLSPSSFLPSPSRQFDPTSRYSDEESDYADATRSYGQVLAFYQLKFRDREHLVAVVQRANTTSPEINKDLDRITGMGSTLMMDVQHLWSVVGRVRFDGSEWVVDRSLGSDAPFIRGEDGELLH